jgi:hypothetical protein
VTAGALLAEIVESLADVTMLGWVVGGSHDDTLEL